MAHGIKFLMSVNIFANVYVIFSKSPKSEIPTNMEPIASTKTAAALVSFAIFADSLISSVIVSIVFSIEVFKSSAAITEKIVKIKTAHDSLLMP